MAFRTFVAGEVLTAANVNDYLMEQAVIACTSATRPGSPNEGMVVYETDTDRISVYTGAAWIPAIDFVNPTITTVTADAGSFTTSETVVATVTAPLVSGAKYRVRFIGGWQTTVADGSVTTAIREDNVTGTVKDERVVPTAVGTGSFLHPFTLEVIYTAGSTANKTFVGTGVRLSGTGTISLDAGTDHPAYLYVELFR